MKKQPEITEATRRDFIHAFCTCYQETPIEKITIKDLAQRAGYSRVTFYNYFRDVYHLRSEIEEEYIDRIARKISANIETGVVFDRFLYAFDKLFSENELYSQALLNNPHNPQFWTRLKDRIIPIALETFGISPDNQKAIYAFEFYIPGVISMIASWLKNGRDIPLEELAGIIQGILQQGLLSQLFSSN